TARAAAAVETRALRIESAPSEGPTVRSSSTCTGSGRAPARSTMARSVASAEVNPPVIWARPEGMRSRICGAEWTLPSSTMARRRPTLASVRSAKARPPGRVEVHRHVGLAGVLVDRDPGGGHVAPGHVGLPLHHEGDLALLVGLLVDPALVEDLVAVRHPALERGVGVDLVVHQLELEQRGLADEGLGPLRILHARELHQDPVVALLLDRGLGHPELVD